MSLAGRTILLTGAGSGIGHATARMAREQGARVAALVERPEQTAALAGIVEPEHVHAVDLTDFEAAAATVARAVDRLGALDGLVGAAGITIRGNAMQSSARDWQRVIDINLSANFHVAKAAMPALIASGRGSIVFVSSQLSIVAKEGAPAYAASKAGVNGLMRALALEHAADNVRVNAVGPGPTATPMNEELRSNPEAYEDRRKRIPLGRYGLPEEVAAPICFLLSGGAAFMTGTLVLVDGGYTAE